MPTIMNTTLRVSLKEHVEHVREKLASGVKCQKARNQLVIDYYSEHIATCKESIKNDQKKLDNLEPNEECIRDLYTDRIERNEESIIEYQKTVQKCQSKTEKDFENEACDVFKITHPDNIADGIPEETAFDIQFQQIMELEGVDMSKFTMGTSTVSNDMKLDVANIANIEEHFFNNIRQLDIQKLALLKPNGIEEVV